MMYSLGDRVRIKATLDDEWPGRVGTIRNRGIDSALNVWYWVAFENGEGGQYFAGQLEPA